MRCPKCKSYNHDKANYCIKCGSSLNTAQNITIKKYHIFFIVLLILLLFLLSVLFFIIKTANPTHIPICIKKTKNDTNIVSEKYLYENKLDSEKKHKTKIVKKTLASDRKIVLSPTDKLFYQAIELKNINPLKSLILFVEGYNIETLSNIEKTSLNLKSLNIERNIREIISRLYQMGEDDEIILLITPDILNKMQSLSICKDVMLIITEKLGFAKAIQFAESVKHQPFFTTAPIRKSIDNMILSLYYNWLLQQLNSKNIDNAESIYEFAANEFPGNAEIELFGVEIALFKGDWEKAELLLESINLPDALLTRADKLGNKISELKGSKGKTIIRFKPGTKHIPLLAELNGKLKQKFLLDTGASFITVPSSAIGKLRLKVGSNTPVRNISTAGGIKKAKEVVLDSVKLGSCIVHNIKALVLDIPGQSDLGLLGLNFLQLFHVEMDNKKGILILKPK